jgi:hypothetical protein
MIKMGMTANVSLGSGRAQCKICDKKITKGQSQIVMAAWRSSGSVHGNPWECDPDQRKVDVEQLAEAVMTAPVPRKKRGKVKP